MNKRINLKSELKTVLTLLLFFMSGAIAFAQSINVTGVVTDGLTKEPLTGVSVVVKGTTTGTFTDIEGRYSISAAKNAALVFSFLGFESKEVPVTGEIINISLESQDFQIDEVVVVGAVMKKSDLTGAVSGVSGKVLQERPVTNINQALQGRVAGVLINSAAKPGDDSTRST